MEEITDEYLDIIKEITHYENKIIELNDRLKNTNKYKLYDNNVDNSNLYSNIENEYDLLEKTDIIELINKRQKLFELNLFGKNNWIPNNFSNNKCMLCKNQFRLLFNKHHCRLCGYVICSKCSFARINKLRVCNLCYYIKMNLIK